MDFSELNKEMTFTSSSSNVSCNNVDVIDDSTVEIEEVFLIELFSGDSAVLILSPNVSVTIQDNDGMFIIIMMRLVGELLYTYSCQCGVC